eukprot:1148889-Pelagomonas_calceolata.AAC.1
MGAHQAFRLLFVEAGRRRAQEKERNISLAVKQSLHQLRERTQVSESSTAHSPNRSNQHWIINVPLPIPQNSCAGCCNIAQRQSLLKGTQ